MDDWDEEFKLRTGQYPFTGTWCITMLDGRVEQGSTGVYISETGGFHPWTYPHEILITNPTINNARIP